MTWSFQTEPCNIKSVAIKYWPYNMYGVVCLHHFRYNLVLIPKCHFLTKPNKDQDWTNICFYLMCDRKWQKLNCWIFPLNLSTSSNVSVQGRTVKYVCIYVIKMGGNYIYCIFIDVTPDSLWSTKGKAPKKSHSKGQ